MLLECGLWVLAGAGAPSHTRIVASLQISPSLIGAGVGATLSAGVVWLLLTFALGRVYCSSVCPIGTLQDIAWHLRLRIRPRKGRYRKGSDARYLMLGIYIAALVAAIGCIPLLLEPWPAFVNIISQGSAHGMHPALKGLEVGAMLGLICAVVSALAVLLYALLWGRDFCNDVCPLGTALRVVGSHAVMHIELEPYKCDSCLKCEDVCKASCIDIKTRTIDNGRCVRCFNCVAACPRDAIRYTPDRNGVATALFQRRRQLS